MGATNTVTLADAQQAFINYLRERHLPQPSISSAPAGRTLVNLPAVFWTADSPAVTLQVDQPLPATINAQPHWSWTFGDGSAGPDTPGVAWRPGYLPTDHPGYYLTHAYTATGSPTVTVRVTWTATFTVPGIDQTFTIPDIVLTASRLLTVVQARSQLVAGSG